MESQNQSVVSTERLLMIIAKKTVEIDLLEEQLTKLAKQLKDVAGAAKEEK